MKVLSLDIDYCQFWINYCDFKASLQLPLPNDTFRYKCSCKKTFYLYKNGDIFIQEDLQVSIPDLLQMEKEKIINHHECSGRIVIDKKYGIPEGFCMFFKDCNSVSIKDFQFDGIDFCPKLTVYSKVQDCPAMVLFMNKTSVNETIYQLLIKNFDTHLNIPDQEADQNVIESISDDEAVHRNQESLPRLTGGGRRMLQDFKYICQWCSEETLKQKTKGRFREIKNYRDHFRRAHQDIPFSEFLNHVERDEPKWQCKICRQKMSIGNQLRHQIICRPPNYGKKKGQDDTSSESDSDSDIDIQGPSSSSPQKIVIGPASSASKARSGRIQKGAESSSDSDN